MTPVGVRKNKAGEGGGIAVAVVDNEVGLFFVAVFAVVFVVFFVLFVVVVAVIVAIVVVVVVACPNGRFGSGKAVVERKTLVDYA